MPTPGEKRALIFLASVAALGVGVRGWSAREGANAAASDKAGLARQIESVDSAVASGGVRRRGKGKRASAPADSATAAGGGAAKSSRARASAPPVEGPTDNRAAYFALREREDAARARIEGRGASPTGRRSPDRRATSAPMRGRELPPVDLDRATEEEIAAVPSVGAALARRIVADRVANGPFGSIDELRRVRGVSAALARRLAPYVTFSLVPVTPGGTVTPERAPSSRKRRSPGVSQP